MKLTSSKIKTGMARETIQKQNRFNIAHFANGHVRLPALLLLVTGKLRHLAKEDRTTTFVQVKSIPIVSKSTLLWKQKHTIYTMHWQGGNGSRSPSDMTTNDMKVRAHDQARVWRKEHMYIMQHLCCMLKTHTHIHTIWENETRYCLHRGINDEQGVFNQNRRKQKFKSEYVFSNMCAYHFYLKRLPIINE